MAWVFSHVMPKHVLSMRKLFWAHKAREKPFFVQMYPHVVYQATFPREFLMTNLTDQPLDFVVSGYMSQHVMFIRKVFKTNVTLVWPFAGVYPHVRLQETSLRERLFAHFARIWLIPVVPLDMPHNRTFVFETHAADIASIRPYAVVPSQMTF